MTDYSLWPERRISIRTLFLDSLNPRIPPGIATPSQRELIEELVAHDDVYGLARHISLNGFDPVELLIGVDEDSRTVTVEGNRRLAALKLLDTPGLAPATQQERFKKLAAHQQSPFTKVRVVIAPSREAAAPLILRKHTREQIEKWSPLMQARFYRRLVSETGEPIEDLAKRYGVTPGDIRDFLQLDAMYEVALSLDLPAPVSAVVHDPRNFPASVLQRLVEMVKFKDLLGIEFDRDGRVTAKAKPKEFRKAYAKVIADVATGAINTRALNKVEDAETYLKALRAVAPTKQVRRVSMDALTGTSPATAPAPERPAAAKSERAKPPRLIPSTIRCTLDDPRAREIFRELKALDPGRFPNAHAVLLRMLLEFGVSHYLTKTGLIEPLLEKMRKKTGRVDWAPTLTQMLRELLKDQALAMRPHARKAVIRMIGDGGQSILSVETLDGFVHNTFEWPDERALERLWRAMEDILVLVLREPEPQSGTGSTS
jgi:hypothetical protein